MKQIFFIFLILTFACTVQPSFSQFGQNKVQYQEFKNWKYIRSKHFDVYYYEGGEYLARYTAIHSERSLVSIEKRLNYSINKRIPVMVYQSHNEFQQTNVISSSLPEGVGGVTELFKNRVTLPFEGKYEQFRHVIHHELVHAVINDMFYGGTIQTAITNNVKVELPLWMNEGLAEYEGIGGYDTPTDMFMRDIALSEYLKGFQNLNGYYAYRGGQAFYWYVAEKYGEQKIGELINRIKSLGSMELAFKSAFNMSVDEFSEQWVRELKKKYLPDIVRYEAIDEFSTRLTNHVKDENYYNSSPAISPDGDRMAFISDREGVFGVYVKELKGKDKPEKQPAEKVISSERALDFEELNLLTPGISWDPTGKKLAVSAKSGGEDALYIVDVASGDYTKKLFGLKTLTSAIWSPDGKTIAFIAGVKHQSDIYLYTVATGKTDKLTNDIFSDQNPIWAPDSKTIYFISDRADYTDGVETIDNFKMWDFNHTLHEIYSIEIDNKSIKRITFDSAEKTSIAISPDAKKLLFVSDINGIGNLYELTFATGDIKAKTNSISGITQLSLSRDGTKLLFTSQIKGGYDIFELRFPFERKPYDSLPLTRFKQQDKEYQNSLSAITSPVPTLDSISKQPILGYGKVSVDFTRQQVIFPNPDIAKPTAQINAGALSPEVELADTSITAPQDYKISFTPDIILSTVGYSSFFGAQGVTQLLFSDMLGNHQLYGTMNLRYDLKNSDFFVAYNYLPEVVDYQIALFNSIGYATLLNENTFRYNSFRFRDFGVTLGASYAFNRYRRLDWNVTYHNSARDNIDMPTDPSITRNLFVPEVRFVHDNTQWGWFAPNKGLRYFLGLQVAPKLSEGSIGFLTLSSDIRQYFNFWNGYITFAFRAAGSASFGPNPQRFALGGVDNWINPTISNNVFPFNNPEDFTFIQSRLVYTLRGWDINHINGEKYVVANGEVRFPLLALIPAIPIPLSFQGAFFYDIGAAWDSEFSASRIDEFGNEVPNNLLLSTGFSIRSGILGLPIRFDIAWRNNYTAWSEPNYLLSLGLDF
ncbi:MAG: PD40 domain-containing protein [Ignavibacteria bacterium]|nr:PD40 domain-containing protein [Ignavibacteria bacterium]